MNSNSACILVLGGSGTLGSAIAARLVEKGSRVLSTGFNQMPKVGEGFQFDCREVPEIDRLMSWIDSRGVTVEGVVHCIGITSDSALIKQSDEQWDRVLDVNLKSAFRLSKAILPKLMKQKKGHFVFISSWSGLCGRMGQSSYSASKAGLIAFSQSLAREYASRGIRSNCIVPGVFESPFTKKLSEDQLQAIWKTSALSGFCDLRETAQFISNLVMMQDVTGQVFHLDGRITRTY